MNAFNECNNLVKAVFPEHVTIDSGAFAECYNLEHVHMPSSIRKIEGDAFAGCVKLDIFFNNLVACIDK